MVTNKFFIKNFSRPRLGDKHSFQSSCVPPPSFESWQALQNEKDQCLRIGLKRFCAPARTRTWNDGSEDRSDIHFTTGAISVLYIIVCVRGKVNRKL